MITKSAKLVLYPYLSSKQVEQKLEPHFFNEKVDGSIYTDEELATFNVLTRDPVSGHVDSLINYVLSHTGALADNVSKLIASVPKRSSPNLTDDEKLELLVPRNMQTPAEMASVQRVLEDYLSAQIDLDKKDDKSSSVHDGKSVPGSDGTPSSTPAADGNV